MRMLTGNKTLLKRIAYHITNTAWDSEAGKPDEWTKALEKHEDKSVETNRDENIYESELEDIMEPEEKFKASLIKHGCNPMKK